MGTVCLLPLIGNLQLLLLCTALCHLFQTEGRKKDMPGACLPASASLLLCIPYKPLPHATTNTCLCASHLCNAARSLWRGARCAVLAPLHPLFRLCLGRVLVQDVHRCIRCASLLLAARLVAHAWIWGRSLYACTSPAYTTCHPGACLALPLSRLPHASARNMPACRFSLLITPCAPCRHATHASGSLLLLSACIRVDSGQDGTCHLFLPATCHSFLPSACFTYYHCLQLPPYLTHITPATTFAYLSTFHTTSLLPFAPSLLPFLLPSCYLHYPTLHPSHRRAASSESGCAAPANAYL